MTQEAKRATTDSTLEEVRQNLRILCELGRLAGISTSLETFLDQAVIQVARATEINHVKILRYRPETADLLVVAGIGWKPGVVGRAILSADLRSPPGRSFQTGEPIAISDTDDQDEYEISPMLREHGIVALANAPVLIGGSAWGVLEVDSTKPRDFGSDTGDFLTAAGALIGTCVRRHAAPTQADRLTTAMLEAQHRETLLREMQHRIKNSFQLILGSITLQKRRYPAGDVQTALDDAAERIRAISLAHEQLAPRAGSEAINLTDYLRALCQAIKRQVDGIEVEIEADEVHVPIEHAVAIGLILNEAATNCVKHAFDESGGRISVRLQAGVGFGEARLTIADNGRGMQETRSSGSGLKLISALARKISAKVERHSSAQGTTVILQFPALA